MNQLEGTGPPPAPKEKIDSLPTIVVTEEHVGTLPMASDSSVTLWISPTLFLCWKMKIQKYWDGTFPVSLKKLENQSPHSKKVMLFLGW